MDGNGRWAQNRDLPRVEGHREGICAVRRTLEESVRMKLEQLTLFCLSSENWKRPKEEVGFLTQLLAFSLEKELDRLHANGVRLNVIGDAESFGSKVKDAIGKAQDRTSDNESMTLTIALNYGSRRELAIAARNLAESCVAGRIRPDEIDEEHLNRSLSTYGLPDPDLLIRTGGEVRLSNFLLWQLAYTELVFTDTLWPDFDKIVFDKAVSAFQGRQRRFGQTGEQVAPGRSTN